MHSAVRIALNLVAALLLEVLRPAVNGLLRATLLLEQLTSTDPKARQPNALKEGAEDHPHEGYDGRLQEFLKAAGDAYGYHGTIDHIRSSEFGRLQGIWSSNSLSFSSPSRSSYSYYLPYPCPLFNPPPLPRLFTCPQSSHSVSFIAMESCSPCPNPPPLSAFHLSRG
mmetsp:Transcript_26223/g.73516  ORF Transcript_26223/g.73516 Transcript_26223/m.73516 type:complete len:168 (-) Transcript_26223:3642-4145(-)